jgi:cardiolipin synthase A/B
VKSPRGTIAVPIWLLVLQNLALAAFGLILWSVKRRKRPHLDLESEDDLRELMPSIAGVTQGTVVDGNRVELFHNGAFWDQVMRDLERAEKTINFETFLSKEGELTRRLTEVLCRKQKEGVEVRLMLDGSGGKEFGDDGMCQLDEAGCKVQKYHRLSLRNLGIINNRDHRKLVIIDGKLGFIGGHCLVDDWLGDAQDKKHFRDISARVEGPVVAQLQSAFSENWVEETGEIIAGERFFPALEKAGNARAHAVWLSPSGSPSSLKVLHYMLIHAAKKSITIQNPYFLPDPDARKALVEAAGRGVEVRIMIPATTASDAKIVQHASHHHYGTLLKKGVRIYDYERTLLHQKVISIDGCWAVVGSTNFDDRSFEVNDEVSLVVYDESLAQELEATFERDLEHCVEMNLAEWKKRPVNHKLKDFSAFLFNEQL